MPLAAPQLPRIKELCVFSPRAFAIGMAGIFVFYTVLFFIFSLQSEGVIRSLEESLASASVEISRTQLHDVLEITHGPSSLPAPDIAGLYEQTTQGLLPVIEKKSGHTVFEAYKRPYLLPEDKAAIALLVSDYGLSERQSDKALRILPQDVAMILSPYADKPHSWSEAARKNGHELWLQLPLQEEVYPGGDSGSHALLAKNSLRENRNRLLWILSRTPGYIGTVGNTAYLKQQTTPTLRAAAETIYQRGLGFIEIASAGSQDIFKVAFSANAPYAKNDRFFAIVTPENLRELEKFAQTNKFAMAILSPTPKNLELLKDWIATLDDKGITLAPASALAARQHSLEMEAIDPNDLEIQIIEDVEIEEIETKEPTAPQTAPFPEAQEPDKHAVH